MELKKRKAQKVLDNQGSTPLAQLEATIELADKMDELKTAIENIPPTVIPEQKEFPEYPTKMEMELKGVSIITIKGDKGDTPTDEEIIALIEPLIPAPIPGEKGDKGDTMIVEKVIERIETIKEQPIITNEIVEVAKYEEPLKIADKLNTLEEVIDQKVIKGLTKKISDISHNVANQAVGAMPVTTTFVNGKRAKNLTFTGASVTHQGDTATVTVTSGTTSPLTTKGDIYTYDTDNTRLPVGITDQVLTVDPTTDTGLAWKYSERTGQLTYMFANVASDIATYYDAVSLPIYVAGSTGDIQTVGVSTTPTLLGAFATELGYPGVLNIPAGLFHIHYETKKAAGSNNYYSYVEIYKRNLAGTETLLLTSDNSSQTAVNTVQQITVGAPSSDIITLLTTDRIVVKIYGVMVSSTATIDLYFDDNTDARLEMPSPNVDASNFVPYTGATADVNLGSHDLSVQDEAYGAGWNGSLEVPTKNAVYDKIQTIATGITRSVNSISSPTTAGATASTDYVYIVTGTTTLTLPTAVGNTNRYTVKQNGSGVVTVDTTGGQTIDGGATAVLTANIKSSIDLISDNANWLVI